LRPEKRTIEKALERGKGKSGTEREFKSRDIEEIQIESNTEIKRW
jgi:hypothetical protein